MTKWNKEKVILRILNLKKERNRRPTKRMDSTLYSASRKYFGTWNKAMAIAGFKVKEFQKAKLPKKLSPELSYFIGLLITDGHIQFNKIKRIAKISIYSSYEEEVKVIKKLIINLFNYNPGIYKKKKHGFNKRQNYDIYINSKSLSIFINKYFNISFGNKSLITRFPKIFFESDKINLASFLRGVIDGDGWIGKWTISLCSGSKEFLMDFIKALNRFNINIPLPKLQKTAWTIHINKNQSKKLCSYLYSENCSYYPRKRKNLEKSNIFK
ncbi:MAG: hypothetical protein KKA65_03235 [Nanoarchaeota archaeon]|nr:hypothetical protein [Nanoarchaeota archaeon]MBU4351502.1 hypothetical protein [Nanoarchaeota archaeon]MBU4456491.1 hypothetical protein [Nanoarchaeota archaeon]